MVGTDFNEKFPRIGPKTALKLVQKNNSFEEIVSETKFEPGFDYKEIEDVFMNPVSTSINLKDFESRLPYKEKLISFLVEKHDFSRDRVETTLNSFLKKKEETEKQKNLGQWF